MEVNRKMMHVQLPTKNASVIASFATSDKTAQNAVYPQE
jgi:hypothetical protein